MRDLPGDADLPAKALQALFILAEGLGEELQSHGLLQGQVVSVIDLAHATFADALDDAVAGGKNVAGTETPMSGIRRRVRGADPGRRRGRRAPVFPVVPVVPVF